MPKPAQVRTDTPPANDAPEPYQRPGAGWISTAAAAAHLGETPTGFLRRLGRAAKDRPAFTMDGMECRKLGASWKIRLGVWR
jgi:hypothetical protein